MKKKPATTSTEEFCCGFSKRSLDYILRFYLGYVDRLPRIVQKPSAQFTAEKIRQKSFGEFQMGKIGQTASDQFGRISQTPFAKLTIPEMLSRKKYAIVERTLPADVNNPARKYQHCLPSKEVLRQKLLDWTREQEAGV